MSVILIFQNIHFSVILVSPASVKTAPSQTEAGQKRSGIRFASDTLSCWWWSDEIQVRIERAIEAIRKPFRKKIEWSMIQDDRTCIVASTNNNVNMDGCLLLRPGQSQAAIYLSFYHCWCCSAAEAACEIDVRAFVVEELASVSVNSCLC